MKSRAVTIVLLGLATIVSSTASAQPRPLSGWFQNPTVCPTQGAFQQMEDLLKRPQTPARDKEVLRINNQECRTPEAQTGFIMQQHGPTYSLIELVEMLDGQKQKSNGLWWVKTRDIDGFCWNKSCQK